MPSFTPGPWIKQPIEAVSPDHPDYGVAYVIGADLGGLVGAALPWPTEIDEGSFSRVEANARLIAAAPDMLEALKFVVEALGGRVHSHDALKALDDANSAILKAEDSHERA